MDRFRLTLAAAALCLLGVSNFCGTAVAQEGASGEDLAEHFNGRIVVGGSVLDAATGKPMSRVRFTARAEAYDSGSMIMVPSPIHKEEVTGAFRFECEPCSTVRLRLSKDGYRSEELRFAVVTEGGKAVDRSRLQVRLRPLEDPVSLLRLDGELVAAPDESARVLALRPSKLRARSVAAVELPTKADAPDLMVLRLDVAGGADGKALTRRVMEKKVPGNPMTAGHPRPVDASLDFSDLGGVQAYSPTDDSPFRALDEMRRAPEDGYADRLALGSTTERTYFYVLAGERRGKGYVDPPWVDGEGRVRTRVHLWLNDGGTSLESLYR